MKEQTQQEQSLARIDLVRARLLAQGHMVTLDDRIPEKAVAELIPCPTSRLKRWRTEGKGPTCYRPGKTPWYRLADVLDWIESTDSNK